MAGADPLHLTFADIGPEHLGMHVAVTVPAFARADLVLTEIKQARGPEFVVLRGLIRPFGFEVPVDVSRLRDTPVTLYPTLRPEIAAGG